MIDRNLICSAALVVAGCLEAPQPLTDPEFVPFALGVAPDTDVPPEASVRLGFSEAVNMGTLSIVRADGRPVRFVATPADSGDELVVAPDTTWPAGEALFVSLGTDFVTDDGRTVAPPTEPFRFTTSEGTLPNPRAVVREPTPTEPAPVNLRHVAVASSPPLPSPIGAAFLEGPALERVALVASREHEGAVVFDVQGALTPSTTYRLALTHDAVAPGDPATSVVQTSTVVDSIPPVVTSTRVAIDGDSLLVDVDADEPVVVSGTAVDAAGTSTPLASHPVAGRQVRLTSQGHIAGGAQLAVHVVVSDLAGNLAPPIRFEVGFPAATRAHITEVVSTALHDWSDSAGGAVPFDARPGNGAITSTDEWIEIVNDSAEPVSLLSAGLELRTIDRTPAITKVDGAPALYFGDGGNLRAWWPGEALVVRPRGDMSQRDLTVELWSGSTLLDRVTIGAGESGDHEGGSPPDVWHEAIARDADGRFAWCVPTPGDPLPNATCR
ncbi:MAG: Ig-like domain-containing protein [Deltaproteobacteria bacterium]|jgi:hypothetical protein